MPRSAPTLSRAGIGILCSAVVLCAQTAAPSSTVPRQVRISNVFKPVSGERPAPTESVTLSIYSDELGGTPLWTETQNVSIDAAGGYTVLLGATLPDGVSATLFAAGEPRWLGVRFNRPGEPEQKRVQLVSVPYALKAADAETLGGKPASAYLLAPSAVGSAPSDSRGGGANANVKGVRAATAGTTGCIGVFSDSSNLGCSVMWQSNFNIGVGTSSPTSPLVVSKSAGGSLVNDSNAVTQFTSGGNATNFWFNAPTAANGGTNMTVGFATGGAIRSGLLYNIPNNYIALTHAGAGNSATDLVVSSTGNVGVGTSTPSYALDVAGDLNLSGILRYQSSPVLRFQPSSPNIGLGSLALQNNTTGSNNTAVGYDTLYNNSIGGNNTALGSSALGTNTNGSYNTAVGYYALGSSGGSNNGAGSNTAIGYFALGNATSGSGNIGIGDTAGGNITTGSNNIEIGNGGSSGESGVIRIGTLGTQTSFFAAGIAGANVSGVAVVVDTSTGQLGIATSSRRYKEDIHDMGDASRGLLKLRPVMFRYKKPAPDGSKPMQYGLIAEEVAEVYPDLVVRSADGKIETVKYQVLTPMLLNEVQRQESEISAQREQIQMLQQQISDLKAAMISLANANEK